MGATWQVYPGAYSDDRGTDNILIYNDGDVLEVVIRGVRFRGNDFDGLRAVDETLEKLSEQFVLNKNELCACKIECAMPLVIATPDHGSLSGTLHVNLQLGKPAPNGGIETEALRLTIAYDDYLFHTRGSEGLFECGLLDLKAQLPPEHHFVNCFGCAYSDYFYAGQGLFGSMLCFRNCKAEYLSVKSKDEYISIFEKNAGGVQETSVCPEFRRRGRNTGYRG